MKSPSERERALAFAVYEIRMLLAGYLGSQSEAASEVRQAAHLAYALHNVAHGALRGEVADLENVPSALAAIDKMLGSNFLESYGAAREA